MNSDENCRLVYEEAKLIFQNVTMNLREWNSNNFEFLKSLPNGERAAASETTKVLGIVWDDIISIMGSTG